MQQRRDKERAAAAEATRSGTDPVDVLARQILAQGTTGRWTGEGYGGPEQNAREIAKMLSNIGITDIKDFGKFTGVVSNLEKVVRLKDPEDPAKGYVYDETVNGEPTGRTLDVPKDTPVKTSIFTPQNEDAPYPIAHANIVTYGDVFGNKNTKQQLVDTQNYNRKADNIFSGTYTGHGHTGYGVQFAPDGTPYFYTQFGGDTSSMGDIMPIVGLGLSLFAPGIGTAIGTALGATGVAASVIGSAIVQGTMAELSGGDFKDGALKGAIGAGVAPVVANTVGSAVANAMGDSAFNKVVTNAVNSAATAGVTAGLTGKGDVLDSALNAAVASVGGTYGKELGGDTGAKIGTALGKIATGADAEQVLTSTIMDTLKSTVQGALKDSPTKDGAVKVAEAEADVTVPGADDLQKILDGSAGTQLASTDNDAAMQAIDALQKPADAEEDPLLGLSSAEVGQGELDAITGADTGTAPDDALLGLTPTEVGDRGAVESVSVGDDTLDALLGLSSAEVGQGELDAITGAGTVDTVEGGVSTDTTGADTGTETAPVTTGPMGPMTEATTKRYSDEFARYLDSLAEGDKPPPNYNVQDLGVTDENFKSFDENLKKMLDDGNLPTQWKPGADGTFTFTGDDGDTITINPDGSVVDYTEAPKGNLLSDTLTTTPPVTTKPVTTAPVTTAPVTTTPPAVKAADDSSGFNLLSLLALMGGEQKPVQQKPEVNDDPFVAFDFNRPFQVNPFAQNPPTPRMAEGGSIDELLELLQYRGQT
jgi:hypothetical protein